jgi:hypothetical protein
VKASGRLAENTAAKLTGVTPALSAGEGKVEIKTQFSGGNNLLKEPRSVEYKGMLTVEA